MKSAELHLLPADELTSQLHSAQQALALYRDGMLAGKEKNHAHLQQLRRQVARLQTICRAKNIMVS